MKHIGRYLWLDFGSVTAEGQGSFDSTSPFASEWAGSAQDDIAIDCSKRLVMTLLMFSETSIDIQIDDDVV